MNKEVFSISLEELRSAFGGYKLNPTQIRLWYQNFKDMKEKEWVALVDYVIKNLERFPSIAKMRHLKEITKGIIKKDFWDTHSIFWEIKKGIINHRMVPKGQGNSKPKMTTRYEEMDEVRRKNNIYRASEIAKEISKAIEAPINRKKLKYEMF